MAMLNDVEIEIEALLKRRPCIYDMRISYVYNGRDHLLATGNPNHDPAIHGINGYESVKIHKGNTEQPIKTNMKTENLLPFDLEEAKKEPSRVRYVDGDKPDQIVFLDNGTICSVFGGVASIYCFREFNCAFRLTPKRMFVNLYESIHRPTVHECLKQAKDEGKKTCTYLGTYELIPVDKE
jgi:hypothetical protein